YRNGFEIRADPYFRPDMDLVVRRIKADFATEADREQQAVKERLAQLEREQQVLEDRRRLEQLEGEQKRRLAQLEAARQRRLEQLEEERQRQEAAEAKAKVEANFKQKRDIIFKQGETVERLAFRVS